jgi:hypothetical protein
MLLPFGILKVLNIDNFVEGLLSFGCDLCFISLLFICNRLQFKTLDTVIVLCGCKTRSVVLKQVHTLKGVRNIVLLRTFGHNFDKSLGKLS